MRGKLLAGAGLGALLALSGTAAAENRVQYFGSVEGSFLFSTIDDVQGSYTTATCSGPFSACYRDDGATDYGWGGRLHLGMKVDEWSFSVGGLVQQSYGDDSTSDASGSYDYSNRATYWAMDFDVGMEFGLGEGGMVRPFVGLRYAEVHLHQSGEDNIPSALGTYDLNSDAWGLGPRAGASLHLPVGGGFSLDAEAAAFVLFGQLTRDDSSDFTKSGGGTYGPYVDESDETFFGAEAELGVSYNFSLSQHTEGFVTLGYRVDYVADAVQGEQTLYDSHLSDPLYRGGGREDYLTHGPFISFTFRN